MKTIEESMEIFKEMAKANFLESKSKGFMYETYVKIFNTYYDCIGNGDKIFVLNDDEQFIDDARHSTSEIIDQMCKYRVEGINYVWCNDGVTLDPVDCITLLDVIEEEFDRLFVCALQNRRDFDNFWDLCLPESSYKFMADQLN